MRVCLDISSAMTPHPTGIGRYAHQLACALLELPDAPELSLFHNRRLTHQPPSGLEKQARSEAPWGDKPWRAFLLTGIKPPRNWGETIYQCDIFHGTDSITPRIPQPTVITIHDLTTLLFPQHHSGPNRWYQRAALPVMVRRAAAIITDSESTRQDCINRFQLPINKIHTIPVGVNHEHFFPRPRALAQSRVAQQLQLPVPYILAVGTLEPRKNLHRLIQAYARLDGKTPPLIIVGAKGWGQNPISELITELGIQNRVYTPGFVADDLLPDLYSGAEFFIYPSLYEGFGSPVLEALACGAPVITSNVSSLPEVTGDAALLVDPLDVEAIAQGMSMLLADTSLTRSLVERSTGRASRFSWKRTAQETLDLYRQTYQQFGTAQP